MAKIFDVIHEYRDAINRNEKTMLMDMARKWRPGYRYLLQQVDDLTALIAAKQEAGEPVEIEYLYSLQRYQDMMDQAGKMILNYNDAAAGIISGEEAEAYELGVDSASSLVEAAEPDDPMWTRVNKPESRIMAGMLSEPSPLSKLLDESYSLTRSAINDTLMTGLSTGQGSSWIADQLANACLIPFKRAQVIARTEVNRTYREANLETLRESRAVKGYRRMCYPNTACLACLMLDGEYYDKKEDFSDHPNGKCSAVPVTKHFDPIEEPEWERGQEWFEKQDEATQRRIMGAGRYDLWKNQGVDPRSMVYIKQNDVWGGNPTVKPLKMLGK